MPPPTQFCNCPRPFHTPLCVPHRLPANGLTHATKTRIRHLTCCADRRACPQYAPPCQTCAGSQAPRSRRHTGGHYRLDITSSRNRCFALSRESDVGMGQESRDEECVSQCRAEFLFGGTRSRRNWLSTGRGHPRGRCEARRPIAAFRGGTGETAAVFHLASTEGNVLNEDV